jgi:ankyrin repeat protein
MEVILKRNLQLVDDGKLLTIAVTNKNKLKLLLEHTNLNVNGNNGAILESASLGYYDSVELLLKHGADVHSNHDRSLLNAVIRGDINMVYLLLQYGANPYAKNEQGVQWILKCARGSQQIHGLFEKKTSILERIYNIYKRLIK